MRRRSSGPGFGISIFSSNRETTALSTCFGWLVAASTNSGRVFFFTPSIWVSNSVTMSPVNWSPLPPSREAAADSISSMKRIAGAFARARSNSSRTLIADCPT
jgi:hypothetical protein